MDNIRPHIAIIEEEIPVKCFCGESIDFWKLAGHVREEHVGYPIKRMELRLEEVSGGAWEN